MKKCSPFSSFPSSPFLSHSYFPGGEGGKMSRRKKNTLSYRWEDERAKVCFSRKRISKIDY